MCFLFQIFFQKINKKSCEDYLIDKFKPLFNKKTKAAKPPKTADLNMMSTLYLIPRQRQISKTKWQPLYTLEKQHQRNWLCVTLVLCL